MMGRRKGELTTTTIDKQWPHQVAVPNRRTVGEHPAMMEFCKGRDHSPRGHSFAENREWHVVFCFGKEEDALAFAERFDGRIIDPRTRPKWPTRTRTSRRS
jgi:hypothetical protein